MQLNMKSINAKVSANGRGSSAPDGVDNSLVVSAIEFFKNELFTRAARFITIYDSDISYSYTDDGVEFNFSQEVNTRKSLYPKGYPEGATEFVALINHGFSAKNLAYGQWVNRNGQYVRPGFTVSKQSRAGAFFVQDAVANFNSVYKNSRIRAVYNKKFDLNGFDGG